MRQHSREKSPLESTHGKCEKSYILKMGETKMHDEAPLTIFGVWRVIVQHPINNVVIAIMRIVFVTLQITSECGQCLCWECKFNIRLCKWCRSM